jgi:hypothetical protein
MVFWVNLQAGRQAGHSNKGGSGRWAGGCVGASRALGKGHGKGSGRAGQGGFAQHVAVRAGSPGSAASSRCTLSTNLKMFRTYRKPIATYSPIHILRLPGRPTSAFLREGGRRAGRQPGSQAGGWVWLCGVEVSVAAYCQEQHASDGTQVQHSLSPAAA